MPNQAALTIKVSNVLAIVVIAGIASGHLLTAAIAGAAGCINILAGGFLRKY